MKATVDAFGGIDILVNNASALDTGLAPVDKFDDSRALTGQVVVSDFGDTL